VPDARHPVPRDRELQDVRHGQSPDLGRTGFDHRSRLHHAEARGVREMAHRLFVGVGDHSLRHRVRRRQHLCQGSGSGEAAMSTVTAHSVAASSSFSKTIGGVIVGTYAIITILPLLWIFLTGFKTPTDSISYPPKIISELSVEGYVNLFTTRTRQTPEFLASLPPPETWYERLVRSRNMVIAGPSKVVPRFINSMVIGFGSPFPPARLGPIAAYAFSRFRVPLADDLLFFILSTRMMPPIAVAIPIYLMFRNLGLTDTKLGMILLYTAVNVSLAVWLLRGFMDEIPREYEEAAMVDGYTRLQAFFKVVLPQATTGRAATAIFCL